MNKTSTTLTVENYYSQEMNKKYMSVSQVKGFMTCEAREKAKISGEYIPADTSALLQGRVLETLLLEPNKIEQFMGENPELFMKNGSLKSDHRKVLEMVERAKRDAVFMDYIGDEFTSNYQHLVYGDIGGVKFKGLIDIYQPGICIVDLKGVKDFAPIWDSNKGRKVNFISYWGYDMQLAVYQELLMQRTGDKLPVYIAGITKDFYVLPQGVEVVKMDGNPQESELGVLLDNGTFIILNIENEMLYSSEKIYELNDLGIGIDLMYKYPNWIDYLFRNSYSD